METNSVTAEVTTPVGFDDADVVIDASLDARRWKAFAVLAIVQFMLVLDDTVVNVALPTIERELHFSAANLTWIVSGYLLPFAGLMLLWGRISDLVGRRLLFMIGTATFATASLTSGLAQGELMLICARIGQGVGAAMVAPAALSLVLGTFPDRVERTKAVGLWGGLGALGATVGIAVGGAIVNSFSWRWIFFINLPIAAVALVLLPRLVAESRSDHVGRIDYLGGVTLTAGLGSVVYGLINAGDHSWTATATIVAFIAGGVLLVAFVVAELTVRTPLIPLRFFAHGPRAAAVLGLVGLTVSFFGFFFETTLYMQQVLHFSPLKTGLAYVPAGLALIFGVGVTQMLLPRAGVRPLSTLGPLLTAGGMFWLVHTTTVSSSYTAAMLGPFLLIGFGQGLTVPSLQVAGTYHAEAEFRGLASGLLLVAQQLGGAIGIAVLVTLATSRIKDHVASGIAQPIAQVSGLHLAVTLSGYVSIAVAAITVGLLGRIVPSAEDIKNAELG
ncbi:MAG: putative transrane efflux protein [Ilumatobacteraceae bacterium]|nr:putative transrane efflux protein [Ilumatobacteraceae bacterium]